MIPLLIAASIVRDILVWSFHAAPIYVATNLMPSPTTPVHSLDPKIRFKVFYRVVPILYPTLIGFTAWANSISGFTDCHADSFSASRAWFARQLTVQ